MNFIPDYTSVDDPTSVEQSWPQVTWHAFDLTVRWLKLTAQLGASTYLYAGLITSFIFRVITA